MSHSVDFICLSYKNSDYLIEKSSITSSYYLGQKQTENLVFNLPFIDNNPEVINFDFIAEKGFSDSTTSEEVMILEIDGKLYSTTAEAFVKNIDLKSFMLFGSIMDNFCQSKGLLAVRYLENKRIQYLINLEQMIKNFRES